MAAAGRQQLFAAMPAAGARLAGIRFPANPREENKTLKSAYDFVYP